MSDVVTAPAATAGPPPTADAQDPLPESNWFWRRVFVFVFSVVGCIALGVILWMLFGLGRATLGMVIRLSELDDKQGLSAAVDAIKVISDQLGMLGFWVIMLLLTDRILYLIAPSAEQAAKMLATVSAWKGGISTSSTSRATSPDGSTAEDTKTAGPSGTQPAPPAPPAAHVAAGTAVLE